MTAKIRALWDRLKDLLKPDIIGWLLVALGIILRLRQYIANRSFWADEASLALNLINRTFAGLTKPLDFEQGAPIGFLFIEKSAIAILGNRDYILRLFPFLSGILACILFYLIVISLTRNKISSLFAVLLFAISWPLIYYSSELKQYSSDVMIGLLLVYLSLKCLDERARVRNFLLIGIAGIIGIWISHPSAFVLAGIGVTLTIKKLFKRSYTHLVWILCLGLAWIATLGLEYFVSLRYLIGNNYLTTYWKHGFIPLPPWRNPSWFLQSYLSLLITISPSLDRWYLASVCSLLIACGIISFLLRNRIFTLLIILPFLMVSIASAMQRYPLRGRFMLFLVPFAILLMAEGLGQIYSLLGKWNQILGATISAAIVAFLLWVPLSGINYKFRVPPMGQDIKPVMKYVEANRAPNDIVYVYHSARNAFNYYAPFYSLDKGNVISGNDLPQPLALDQFYNDINQLKGKDRVWIIFSNIVDCGGCNEDMETFYVQYIDQFGSTKDNFKAVGADVYLYDLNR